MDLIVWSRLSGITWWNKIAISNGVRGRGLFTTQSIAANDIVLSVPLRATFSFLNFEYERKFPIKVAPHDYGLSLSWWPDLDWGTFALIAWLTSKSLQRNPNTNPYIQALPRYMDSPQSDALENPNAPFGILRSIALQSMRSKEYVEATESLITYSNSHRAQFDQEFLWLYTMVRSRSIPLWSSQGGHEAFRNTVYGKHSENSNGDMCCIVPMLDMINHASADANVSIGFPGEEVSDLIIEHSASKPVEVDLSDDFCLPRISPKAFIVVRAVQDLPAGIELLMNYNAFYGFDEEIFSAWFDIPLREGLSQGDGRQEFKYRMKKG